MLNQIFVIARAILVDVGPTTINNVLYKFKAEPQTSVSIWLLTAVEFPENDGKAGELAKKSTETKEVKTSADFWQTSGTTHKNFKVCTAPQQSGPRNYSR